MRALFITAVLLTTTPAFAGNAYDAARARATKALKPQRNKSTACRRARKGRARTFAMRSDK